MEGTARRSSGSHMFISRRVSQGMIYFVLRVSLQRKTLFLSETLTALHHAAHRVSRKSCVIIARLVLEIPV